MVLDSFGHVVRSAALGEVDLAVHADVFHGLVHERVAHDPHLGEVDRTAAGAQDLAFEERESRVAPAGAAAVSYTHLNANIIWGTSEKPQLGNAIELVVVATGFAGDVSAAGTMKQIIPPVRSVEPAKDPVAPVLEPIKPVVPPKAAVQRPPEQVMLGAKSTRYSNIELLLSKPAYQSRNSKFVVQMPGGRKEVLKEENDAGQQAQQDAPVSYTHLA